MENSEKNDWAQHIDASVESWVNNEWLEKKKQLYSAKSDFFLKEISDLKKLSISLGNEKIEIKKLKKRSPLSAQKWGVFDIEVVDKTENLKKLVFLCSDIESVDKIGMFQNVEELTYCECLNSDTKEVKTLDGMFRNCKRLVTSKIKKLLSLYRVLGENSDTTLEFLFENCVSLVNVWLPKWNPSSRQKKPYTIFNGVFTSDKIVYIYCGSTSEYRRSLKKLYPDLIGNSIIINNSFFYMCG